MAVIFLCVGISALCINLFFATGSSAITIDISPEKSIATLENEVHITCASDNEDNGKEIIMMEITRNNQPPIAFLRGCVNVSVSNEGSSQFQAKGLIDNDTGKSFLDLTLLRPRSEDTGIYTCIVYHVSKAGILQEEKRSKTLTVEKLDVSSLETVLNEIQDKLMRNERNNDKRIDEMKTQNSIAMMKTNRLETQLGNQSQEIQGLTEKVNSVSAFAATSFKSPLQPVAGQTLVFPDVITQQGTDYDATTGIFTASRAGLYQFNLVLTSYGAGANVYAELTKNAKIVSRMYAIDSNYSDQSAINALVSLDIGDQVKTHIHFIKGKIEGNPYSIFSGFLVRPF